VVSQAAVSTLDELRDDFVKTYAPTCLKIRTKSKGLTPLILNEIQLYVHGKIEEQKAKTGKVRAIILKARQTGISTYVEGRFYYLVTGEFGQRAHILTHEDKATNNLFKMVDRYHEYCPSKVRPHTGKANAKELYFDRLDSGYGVSTAHTKGTGRSDTVQKLHWSEVAFSRNAEDHMAGLGQTVPDEAGTEIILESTANGIGNLFHRKWQEAVKGHDEEGEVTEYISIFVPWFWMKEYQKPVPKGFQIDEEEGIYKDAYDLSMEQMAWRRGKIKDDFDDQVWWFRQEYPATPDEAFQSPTKDPFIIPDIVVRARKHNIEFKDLVGAKVMGVDPAWYGPDRTSTIKRKGRRAWDKKSYVRKSTMEVAGIVARDIVEERKTGDPFAAVFVDMVGIGAGVYDRLIELGFTEVIGINSGAKATDPEQYWNKKSEMWSDCKTWLNNWPCDLPEDDLSLQADLCSPGYDHDSSSYRLKIESKDKMRARNVRSPDDADALVMTFAEPVQPSAQKIDPKRKSNWRTA